MRTQFFFTIAAILLLQAIACAQLSTAWITQYGTIANEIGYGIAVDSTGQAWVTGSTTGDLGGTGNLGSEDFFLSHISSTGSVISTNQRGSVAVDRTLGVAIIGNTSIFTGGFTAGSPDGQTSISPTDNAILRYTADGVWQSTRLTGSTQIDKINSLTANSTNLFSAGDTGGSYGGQTNSGGGDAVISKRDSTGALVWTRFVGTSGSDQGFGIAIDTIGNSYLTGYTQGTLPGAVRAGNLDIFVVKYDSSGARTLIIQRGTAADDVAKSIKVDLGGNIYIAGLTLGNLDGQANAGGNDGFLTKLDSAGNLLWTRLFGSSAADVIETLDLDSFGNVWVGGYSAGNIEGHINAGGYDAFVARYDANGNVLATQFLATTADDLILSLSTTVDGGVEVSGYTAGSLGGTNLGGNDIFIAKVVPEPGVCALLVAAIGALASKRQRLPVMGGGVAS